MKMSLLVAVVLSGFVIQCSGRKVVTEEDLVKTQSDQGAPAASNPRERRAVLAMGLPWRKRATELGQAQ